MADEIISTYHQVDEGVVLRAPIDGIVTNLEHSTGIFAVHISETDSHIIYAPSDCRIRYTREDHNLWLRTGIYEIGDNAKTERLVIGFQPLTSIEYEVWLEVGRNQHIATSIKFDKAELVGTMFRKGERIGQILYGSSFYEIHLKVKDNVDSEIITTLGSRIKGNQTDVAMLKTKPKKDDDGCFFCWY